jgi:hypothetical protein
MNDAIKMQISAFVDGELPANEAELLLRRLGQDAAMRQQVSQYLEIGRAVRRERDLPGMNELRGRIASALGDELTPAEDEQKVVGSALMTPTTGVAVAATVAALALVGLSQLSGPVDLQLQQAVTIDEGPVAYTEPNIDRVLAEQPSEMLLQYLRSHGDASSGVGPNGILALPATFNVSESIKVAPDPHLVSPHADESAGVDEESATTDTP